MTFHGGKDTLLNYTEKRKERIKYRWIYFIDYREVKNSKLMAVIANGELKIKEIYSV